MLAPTAGWGAKQWPAERFGDLAIQLARQGHRVLVNAAPSHLPDAVAERVIAAARASDPMLAQAVELVRPQLAQLIALLRRTSLVVAGDTGPLHLAAELGIPTVGLFGPTDPARTGPCFGASIVLRDPGSVTDHRRHRETEAGLQRIQVSEVAAAAMELLRRVDASKR